MADWYVILVLAIIAITAVLVLASSIALLLWARCIRAERSIVALYDIVNAHRERMNRIEDSRSEVQNPSEKE
jgi:hypothetical protein